MPTTKTSRTAFVDNLRLSLIVLVVTTHSAITYSGIGSWYYKQDIAYGETSRLFFVMLEGFLQAFFMGTLFMIAGYFAAASHAKRGGREFALSRVARLGLPTLFYMAVIHPVTVYFLAQKPPALAAGSFSAYYFDYLFSTSFIAGTGPMWFALALLVFSLVFASVRAVSGPDPGQRQRPAHFLKYALALAPLAALVAYLIRIPFPIGTSVLNMQLCFFAQYVILFAFGIKAYRGDWLMTADYRSGRTLVAFALCIWPTLGLLSLLGDVSGAGLGPFMGGGTWQSALWALWESVTGVCMALGLPGLFREKGGGSNPTLAGMSQAAFAVYVFHAPLVVALARIIEPVEAAAVAKFFMLLALDLPVCFVCGKLLIRIPGFSYMLRQ